MNYLLTENEYNLLKEKAECFDKLTKDSTMIFGSVDYSRLPFTRYFIISKDEAIEQMKVKIEELNQEIRTFHKKNQSLDKEIEKMNNSKWYQKLNPFKCES